MDMSKDNKEQPKQEVELVKESLNIDEIFANDPEGYATKFTPKGRELIIGYLNSRPMTEVEPFFQSMFDIEDQDPFFTIPWVKRLFDYLRNVCPRGEARNVVMGLAQNTLIFKKTEAKPEAEEEAKPKAEEEAKPKAEEEIKPETETDKK